MVSVSLYHQKRQTIELTIVDFELDVKKGGRCSDFMEITTEIGARYFHDCGSLGKELIRIASHSATIRFRTGMSSLTQRGFLVHFRGVLNGRVWVGTNSGRGWWDNWDRFTKIKGS